MPAKAGKYSHRQKPVTAVPAYYSTVNEKIQVQKDRFICLY